LKKIGSVLLILVELLTITVSTYLSYYHRVTHCNEHKRKLMHDSEKVYSKLFLSHDRHTNYYKRLVLLDHCSNIHIQYNHSSVILLFLSPQTSFHIFLSTTHYNFINTLDDAGLCQVLEILPVKEKQTIIS
jgi:hypothetical protein